MSLPVLNIAALLLLLATTVYTDTRFHRIPNYICLAGAVLGIAFGLCVQGWSGLGNSLAGMATGFLLFIPFYILGGMAAGDVKLMAAIGALTGIPLIMKIVMASLVSGALLGIVWLIKHQGLHEFLSRYWLMGKMSFYSGKLSYIPPNRGSAALAQFPYALAIATGSFIAVLFLQ